jgi:anti-sigma B factor antagonist
VFNPADRSPFHDPSLHIDTVVGRSGILSHQAMRVRTMSSTTSPRLLLDSVDGATVVTFAEKSLINGQLIQEVAAELDLLSEPALLKVLVNFGGVQFLSSTLLAELLRISWRVSAAGGQIKLCCIAPDLIEIFRATGFDRIFQIHDEEWRALDSF